VENHYKFHTENMIADQTDDDFDAPKKRSMLKKTFKTIGKVKKIKPRFRKSSEIKMNLLNSCSSFDYNPDELDCDFPGEYDSDEEEVSEGIAEEGGEKGEDDTDLGTQETSLAHTESFDSNAQAKDGEVNKSSGSKESSRTKKMGWARITRKSKSKDKDSESTDVSSDLQGDTKNNEEATSIAGTSQTRTMVKGHTSMMQVTDQIELKNAEETSRATEASRIQLVNEEDAEDTDSQLGKRDDASATESATSGKKRSVLKKTLKAIGKVKPKFKSGKSKKVQVDTSNMGMGEGGVGEEVDSDREGSVGKDKADDVNEAVSPVKEEDVDVEDYIEQATKAAAALSDPPDSPAKIRREKRNSKKTEKKQAIMGWYRTPSNSKSKSKHETFDSSNKTTAPVPEKANKVEAHIDTKNEAKNLNNTINTATDPADTTLKAPQDRNKAKGTEQSNPEADLSTQDKTNTEAPLSPTPTKSTPHHKSPRTSSSPMKSARGKKPKQVSPKRDKGSRTTADSEHRRSEQYQSNLLTTAPDLNASSASLNAHSQQNHSTKSLNRASDGKSHRKPSDRTSSSTRSLHNNKQPEMAQATEKNNEETLKRCSEIFATDSGMGGYFAKIQDLKQKDLALSDKSGNSADELDGELLTEEEHAKTNDNRAFKTPKHIKKLFGGIKRSSSKDAEKSPKEKATNLIKPELNVGDSTDETTKLIEQLSSMLSPSMRTERKRVKSESTRNTRALDVEDSPIKYFPEIPTEKKTRLSDIRRVMEESRSDSYRASGDVDIAQRSARHSLREQRRTVIGMQGDKESTDSSPTSVVSTPPPDESYTSTPTQSRRRRISRGSEGDGGTRDFADHSHRSRSSSEGSDDEGQRLTPTQRKHRPRLTGHNSVENFSSTDVLSPSKTTERHGRHRHRKNSDDLSKHSPVKETEDGARGNAPDSETVPTIDRPLESPAANEIASPSIVENDDRRRRSRNSNEVASKRSQARESEDGLIVDAEDIEKTRVSDAPFQTRHRHRRDRGPTDMLKKRLSSKDLEPDYATMDEVYDNKTPTTEESPTHSAQVAERHESTDDSKGREATKQTQSVQKRRRPRSYSGNDSAQKRSSMEASIQDDTNQENEAIEEPNVPIEAESRSQRQDEYRDNADRDDVRKLYSPNRRRRPRSSMQPPIPEEGTIGEEDEDTQPSPSASASTQQGNSDGNHRETPASDESLSSSEREKSSASLSQPKKNIDGDDERIEIPFTSKRSRPSHRRASKAAPKDNSRSTYDRSTSTGSVKKASEKTPISGSNSARVLSTNPDKGLGMKGNTGEAEGKKMKDEETSSEKRDGRTSSRRHHDRSTSTGNVIRTEKPPMPSSSSARLLRTSSDKVRAIENKMGDKGSKSMDEEIPLEKHTVAPKTVGRERETIAPGAQQRPNRPSLAESFELGALKKTSGLFDDGQHSVSTDGDSTMFVKGQMSFSYIKSSDNVGAPQLVIGPQGSRGQTLGVQNVFEK
jgi:hypothetical protein